MFVVIEGIDGCGKSTLTSKIKEKLPEVEIVREPSEGTIGKKIREMLYSFNFDIKENNDVLQLLIAADRYYQMYNHTLHKLKETIVISERYYYSALAYNNGSLLDDDLIMKLHEKLPQPDLIVYLDVDVETAKSRRTESKEDALELISKYEEIDKKYKKIMENKHNVVMLDTNNLSIDEVAEKVIEHIIYLDYEVWIKGKQ